MLEEVVADASIPVDAEADADEQASFRRFLDQTSPADLVRHLGKAKPETDSAPDHRQANSENGEASPDSNPGEPN
jgi:hypothetical protein